MKRLLAIAMLAALVSGCASTQGASGAGGTLKKIQESGTISLGYRESSLPFSFRDRDGKPAGYSVELCQRVAAGVQQQLGLASLKINWVAVTPETRIPQVQNGTVDVECGSTTNTLSRQEQVDFSAMTFVDGGGLLVKKGSGIGSVLDLGGKRVALIRGTTTDRALTGALQKGSVTAQIVEVKEHAAGLAALESGAADAYASDQVILVGLALTAKDPGALALADQQFSYEPYGLMFRRDDPAFRLAVNRVLARLYRSGDVLDIYQRWFGALGRPSALLIAMYALHGLPE